jgi:hypothetical protein
MVAYKWPVSVSARDWPRGNHCGHGGYYRRNEKRPKPHHVAPVARVTLLLQPVNSCLLLLKGVVAQNFSQHERVPFALECFPKLAC